MAYRPPNHAWRGSAAAPPPAANPAVWTASGDTAATGRTRYRNGPSGGTGTISAFGLRCFLLPAHEARTAKPEEQFTVFWRSNHIETFSRQNRNASRMERIGHGRTFLNRRLAASFATIVLEAAFNALTSSPPFRPGLRARSGPVAARRDVLARRLRLPDADRKRRPATVARSPQQYRASQYRFREHRPLAGRASRRHDQDRRHDRRHPGP